MRPHLNVHGQPATSPVFFDNICRLFILGVRSSIFGVSRDCQFKWPHSAICIYSTCNHITSYHVYVHHTHSSHTPLRHDITITRFSRKRNRKITSNEKIAPKIPEPRIQLTEFVPAIYYVETKHCLRYHYFFLFVFDVGMNKKSGYLLYICWETHHGNRYSNYPQNHTWLIFTWIFVVVGIVLN